MELCYFTEREWENGKFLYDFTEDELINLIQSKTPDTVVVMPDSVLYKIGVSSFDLITTICEIEDKHNINIEMEPGFAIETVQQLYKSNTKTDIYKTICLAQ